VARHTSRVSCVWHKEIGGSSSRLGATGELVFWWGLSHPLESLGHLLAESIQIWQAGAGAYDAQTDQNWRR
jgi:hydrogenase/urease accessory protein HupE